MLSNGFVGDRTGKGTASRRRLQKGRRGVSDIIGTILILAITVTLFSSIFFFVTSLPGPTPQSTSQFTSQLGVSKGTETFVNVTYTTGPVLSASPAALKIYLYSSKHTTAFCKNPYSAASGGVTGTLWTAGQKWSLGLNATNVCGAPLSSQNDNITITVVNANKDLVLFQATLPGSQANIPPEFITDGYGPSSPVSNTGPFYVWAQINDDDLNTNSVFANFSSLPGGASGTGYISKCSCMKMSFNSTSGDWVSAQATANSNSVIGNSYPITINATDNKSQANSAVLYVSFLSPQGANLQVMLSASPGNPIIHQNTTVTATISNQGAVGSSNLVVKFTASNGNFCPSQKPGSCPQRTSFNITTSIAPFASGVLVSAYWNATGSLPSGDGRAVITATVSLTSSAITPLVITVYPRTVLIDGTGVAQGSTQPIDPFTFLTTDFNSANIPYSTITATPGSQTITWSGTGSTALINYDVIVWDVGNASSSNPLTNTCLSIQDAQALNTAMTNGKDTWMIGGDAFACSTASNYNGAFGVSSSSQSQAASPAQLSLVGTGIVPKAGYPATMYQGAGSFDSTLTLSGASSYLCTGACGSSNNLATGYKPGGGKGNAFATSFDLATVSSITYYPGGSPYPYTVNTGAQASITYNAFNFLAGFTGSGSPPPNVNYGADWAVSGVVVEPPSISFMSKTFVNVTVRNNGNYTTSITAELLINGIPYPSSAPLKVTLTPTALGGSLTGTITWLPPAVGYLTIGAEILPPSNDSNPGNNILYSSLFNAQTYVGYSVLVVDGAVQLNPDVTNSTIIPSLKAAGYNQSTINYTYIGGLGCGTLGVSLNNYNLVVWNIGRVTNNSGYCPLSDNNANILSSFLVNGGLKSSLLFLGPGLMTDTSDTAVKTFAQSYLGTSITGSLTTAGKYVSSVFGKTTDVVGNGLDIPYNHPNTGNANYTCSQYGTGSTSFYYNVTGTMTDYWQGQNFCAGTREQGNNGWHSAYWAFNTISAGTSGQLSLAFLRVSTFFGRLLPNSDTVIASPDVTFSQVGSNYGNFDTMHPQLEQQYLIVANVTNLGASTASNVGVSIFDGSHILGLQTLTIGGSSVNITGTTLLGVGQTSISWVPLYAGTNEITVKITTSTASQILPGVSNIARGNVSVSFFYDLTMDNRNSWSHNQLYLQQTGFNPSSCSPSPVGTQIFKWDDMNVPKVWPGFGSCSPSGPGAASWGISTTNGLLCYDLSEGGCGSLAIQDSTGTTSGGCGYTYCGDVHWQYSSPITVPSKATGLTSATVSWEQKYSIAQYANGGVVCIVTNTGSIPNGGYGAPLEDMVNCDSSTPSPTPTDSQTTISVADPVVGCYLLPAFTGSSGSGSFSWQQETMNLTSYAGSTIYLAFGFVRGGYDSCESLSSPPALSTPSGWYIDDFMVTFSSNGANPAYTSGGSAVPSDLWRLYPGSALSSSLTQMGTGAPPTGSAWVSAAWDGSTTVFDANMWDSLSSRPIDLSSAIDANLTFTYAFSNVMWVTEWAGHVCYVYTQDPSQGMVLQIAQANTQNWVTVWSANGFDNSCGLWPPHNVGDTYSSYNIYAFNGYTPANTATVTSWGWQPTYVNLNGYVGQVIQLRFLVGTNNGGNGNAGGEYQDTNVCYPMTVYSGASCNPGNSPLASGGMISGIFINGNTSLASGPGPSISLQNPRHATAEALASHAFRDLGKSSQSSIHVPTTVIKSDVVKQVSSSGHVSEGEVQTMLLTSAPSHTMSVARWIPRPATTT